MKLDFNEFAQEMVKRVGEFIPEDFGVDGISLHVVNKNNDTKLTGLTIKLSSSNVAPTIYLEGLFKRYEEGEDINFIAKNIVKNTIDALPDPVVDMDWIKDYSICSGKILPRLVNADMNKSLLGNVPHRTMGDLAITYNLFLPEFEGGNAFISVTNDLFNSWGVSEGELYNQALSNLPVLMPGAVLGMSDIMMDLLSDKTRGNDGDLGCLLNRDEQMFILTNKERKYGASAILDKGLMDEVVRLLGSDFYVLPSSVHELIIVRGELIDEVAALRSMVSEVNDTQVLPEEILSYNVYRYVSDEGLVKA